MPEFRINEAGLFMIVYKTSEIIYETFFFINPPTKKNRILTFCNHIREIPK